MSDNDEFVNLVQAGKIIGATADFVRRLVVNGKLKNYGGVRRGRERTYYKIRKADMEAFKPLDHEPPEPS